MMGMTVTTLQIVSQPLHKSSTQLQLNSVPRLYSHVSIFHRKHCSTLLYSVPNPKRTRQEYGEKLYHNISFFLLSLNPILIHYNNVIVVIIIHFPHVRLDQINPPPTHTHTHKTPPPAVVLDFSAPVIAAAAAAAAPVAVAARMGVVENAKEFLTEGCNKEQPCLWYIYAGAYAILAVATLVQLIRILSRMGEFGWTMQKTFHVLNLVVCSLRAAALFSWNWVDSRENVAVEITLFNIPNLLFFSTYTLLVLFWAEIVHAPKARSVITPRMAYGIVNFLAYVLSVVWFVLCGFEKTSEMGKVLDSVLQVVLDCIGVGVFAAYGYKLLRMLRKAPVHTMMRKKKIGEVTLVTVLAVLCFLGKGVLEIVALVQRKGLDYEKGMLYDALYYGLTEVLVIATSLGVLSGMPPKRRSESYDRLPDAAQ